MFGCLRNRNWFVNLLDCGEEWTQCASTCFWARRKKRGVWFWSGVFRPAADGIDEAWVAFMAMMRLRQPFAIHASANLHGIFQVPILSLLSPFGIIYKRHILITLRLQL